jgi:hypothetical protein
VPNFPRLRALALFGRRSVERAEPRSCRRPKTSTNPDSCGATKALRSITSLARASNGRLMSGLRLPADATMAYALFGLGSRSASGKVNLKGVHRFRGLNSSSNCDSFGTVSKCGALDGMVSQDALDPAYRCAPVSRVSKSSSKPAGTQ